MLRRPRRDLPATFPGGRSPGEAGVVAGVGAVPGPPDPAGARAGHRLRPGLLHRQRGSGRALGDGSPGHRGRASARRPVRPGERPGAGGRPARRALRRRVHEQLPRAPGDKRRGAAPVGGCPRPAEAEWARGRASAEHPARRRGLLGLYRPSRRAHRAQSRGGGRAGRPANGRSPDAVPAVLHEEPPAEAPRPRPRLPGVPARVAAPGEADALHRRASRVTTGGPPVGLRIRGLIVVGIVSSCVAIALLIAAVDPSRTLAVVRQARPEPLVLAVGILAAQVVVRAARWRLLLGKGDDGAQLPFRLVLRALLIGYLGNAALPARLGEAARAGVVARAANRPFGSVLGTVLLAVSYTHLRAHETRH